MKELLIVLLLVRGGFELPGQQTSDKAFTCSLEEIALNEKKGAYMENLLVFRAGHQKGWFYFIHPAIPRYEPYLNLPGFQEVYAADSSLRSRAIIRSQTTYELELPNDYDSTVRYPLLFIFHGGGSNMERVRHHWHHQILERDYIRIYLQSYQHTDYASFTWHSGDPRSDRDLRLLFDRLNIQYAIDTSRVLVAGISAGANYALAMALRGVLPVQGLIAYCPGFPLSLRDRKDFTGLRTKLRIFCLGGELDFYREQQVELCRSFDRSAIVYRYILVDGMKHQYPDQESIYLGKALKFLSTL